MCRDRWSCDAPEIAQDTAARFEVASVKPNVGRDLSIPTRPLPPDGITLTNYPLYEIVRYAYSMQPFRLEGAPAWTRDERFDIAAKPQDRSPTPNAG